jgi:hypothetical protein
MWTITSNETQVLIEWYEEMKREHKDDDEKDKRGRLTVFMWTSVKYLLLHIRFLQEVSKFVFYLNLFLHMHILTNITTNTERVVSCVSPWY